MLPQYFKRLTLILFSTVFYHRAIFGNLNSFKRQTCSAASFSYDSTPKADPIFFNTIEKCLKIRRCLLSVYRPPMGTVAALSASTTGACSLMTGVFLLWSFPILKLTNKEKWYISTRTLRVDGKSPEPLGMDRPNSREAAYLSVVLLLFAYVSPASCIVGRFAENASLLNVFTSGILSLAG